MIAEGVEPNNMKGMTYPDGEHMEMDIIAEAVLIVDTRRQKVFL